jgi:FKBP-type peptidyl-prolyl cis-trans isomerase
MKNIFFTAFFSFLTAGLFANGTNNWPDEKSRASYAIGVILGSQWKEQNFDVDVKSVARGIKDAEAGGMTNYSLTDAARDFDTFKKDFIAKVAAENKAEGEAFLATNKNNPGVVTLPDGLQYKIITQGTGPMPTTNDAVTVNYHATFVNGKPFDGSAPGQPAVRWVRGVVPGEREALLKMKVGSKWKVFIPSDLAYGANSPRGLAPYSVLIFEIELLATKTPAPTGPLTSDIVEVPSADDMKKGAKIETIKPEDFQKLQSQSKTN